MNINSQERENKYQKTKVIFKRCMIWAEKAEFKIILF